MGALLSGMKGDFPLSYEPYKKVLITLNPVAVKTGQTEVHAPGHRNWGIYTCDCGAEFHIGPSLIYGSRQSDKECVKLLEDRLAEDHKNNRPHQNSYEFPE
jgi:hypothetical protein